MHLGRVSTESEHNERESEHSGFTEKSPNPAHKDASPCSTRAVLSVPSFSLNSQTLPEIFSPGSSSPALAHPAGNPFSVSPGLPLGKKKENIWDGHSQFLIAQPRMTGDV